MLPIAILTIWKYTYEYQIISLYGRKLLWQDPREARIRLMLQRPALIYAVAVIAEKAAKRKIESEVATLTANLDDLKTQLKAKKAELKAATKELAKAENKKAAAEAKAAEEAKKGEAEDVLKKLLASGMTAEEILAKLQ